MIYEEKRFMAVSEIEKECCTGCCFYDNGNCQLENPNCFNSGIHLRIKDMWIGIRCWCY